MQPQPPSPDPLAEIPSPSPELPRIAGIIQCRNEWGLIALSIGFALTHHVDEVFVLNDRSTDETHRGLELLQGIWPGRIHVFNQSGGRFLQEAQINTLVHLAQQTHPDWIYIFDADEFLIPKHGQSLKTYLKALPRACKGVRYELKNFISHREFNDQSLSDFLTMDRQGVTDESKQRDALQNFDDIYHGRLNFFHIPFPSKVIFRNEGLKRVAAGCHRVEFQKHTPLHLADDIYAAHLSWLSLERLRRKAEQGQQHVANGFHRKHGWQNQLIFQMANEKRLDQLWERHSLPEPGCPPGDSPTNVQVNLDFRSAIQTTVQTLVQAGFDPQNLCVFKSETIPAMEAPPTLFPLHILIALTSQHHQALASTAAPNPATRFLQRLRQSIAKRLPGGRRGLA